MTKRATIAICGSGQMGAALAARCVEQGGHVISPLAGRSKESRARALAAGVEACSLEDMRAARLIVSVVPPAEAEGVADRLCHLSGDGGPPFIDANALSPMTKSAIAEKITACGGRFVDAAIIGNPPKCGQAGPRFYTCGEYAPEAFLLARFGVDVRTVDGPIGTAAALKMCYAGLNKGLAALTVAVLIAADRAGVAGPLMDEWDISQAFIAGRSRLAVSGMYPKAYRWIAEFEEIAAFTEDDGASSEIFSAIARFFAERSLDGADGAERARLDAILARG